VDEEFAHDGDEGDFEGFVLSEETLMEGLEDRVEAGRREGGHIKSRADFPAPTTNGALAAMLPAVVIVRRHAAQRRRLPAIEGSELGHLGQKHQGRHEAHALGRRQPAEFLLPARARVDLGPEVPIQRRQPLLKDREGLRHLGQERGRQDLLPMGAQDLDHLHKLAPMGHALPQRQLGAAQRRIRRRLLRLGKTLDQRRIERIVFRDEAFRKTEVMDAPGHRRW